MQKIGEQRPTNSLCNASKALAQLGFDTQLLSSRHYVTKKLLELNEVQSLRLREIFLNNNHPMFKREFSAGKHEPFGKTADYQNAIKKANLLKLTELIKLVGVLVQTKVYLFWRSDS